MRGSPFLRSLPFFGLLLSEHARALPEARPRRKDAGVVLGDEVRLRLLDPAAEKLHVIGTSSALLLVQLL